jgi:hypothetical protein
MLSREHHMGEPFGSHFSVARYLITQPASEVPGRWISLDKYDVLREWLILSCPWWLITDYGAAENSIDAAMDYP